MDKIEALEKRVKELEAEVAQLRMRPAMPPVYEYHYHYPQYAPMPAYPYPGLPLGPMWIGGSGGQAGTAG